MDYAEKIKKLRQKSFLSQYKLAQLIGVSNRAVSKWENGISLPTIKNYNKLCKIFNVSMEYFFADTSSHTQANNNKPKGMPSLRLLYKIGSGPSSSHTIGPEKACQIFLSRQLNFQLIFTRHGIQENKKISGRTQYSNSNRKRYMEYINDR